MKTYQFKYKVLIYENKKIVKAELFDTVQEARKYIKEQGEPPLKYGSNNTLTHTLEAS